MLSLRTLSMAEVWLEFFDKFVCKEKVRDVENAKSLASFAKLISF